jgi:hypothetical protein
MFLYNIGYHSCEESDYIQLWHKKKFTQDDLTNMICEAVLETVKAERVKDRKAYIHNFADVFSFVISGGVAVYLVEHFGFKEAKFQESWTCFGWDSIFEKKDWDTYKDKDDPMYKIVKYMNKHGYTWKDDSFLRENKRMKRLHRKNKDKSNTKTTNLKQKDIL